MKATAAPASRNDCEKNITNPSGEAEAIADSVLDARKL